MAEAVVLRAINDDVWHPFRRAYGTQNSEAFLALCTADLIRAGGPAQEVIGFAEYAAQTEEWFAGLIERGDGVSIDFRFSERLTSDELASERGIYRITATRTGEEDRIFYGRFHTFVRKEAGRWRIAVDYDSNDGGTLTAETFAAGAEIDDVARFAGQPMPRLG